MNNMPAHSRYTKEQRIEAMAVYTDKGTLTAVERELGIPKRTVCDWVRSEWWDELITEFRTQKQDEHIQAYHRLTDKALKAAEGAIDKLEGVSLGPSDIKALVVTAATSTDKARLLMNQPTSISQKQDGIEALAKQFAELSHQMRDKEVITVVDMGPSEDTPRGKNGES